MFWMTGTSMSIWTIMITVAFVLNPVKAIFSVNQGKNSLNDQFRMIAFVPFENKGVSLLLPKLTFASINLIIFAMALYKFSSNF
jgi:hypothetical protein